MVPRLYSSPSLGLLLPLINSAGHQVKSSEENRPEASGSDARKMQGDISSIVEFRGSTIDWVSTEPSSSDDEGGAERKVRSWSILWGMRDGSNEECDHGKVASILSLPHSSSVGWSVGAECPRISCFGVIRHPSEDRRRRHRGGSRKIPCPPLQLADPLPFLAAGCPGRRRQGGKFRKDGCKRHPGAKGERC
jgi:hypothetical protein